MFPTGSFGDGIPSVDESCQRKSALRRSPQCPVESSNERSSSCFDKGSGLGGHGKQGGTVGSRALAGIETTQT